MRNRIISTWFAFESRCRLESLNGRAEDEGITKGLIVIAPEWRDLVYGREGQAELARWVEFVAPAQTADSVRGDPSALRDAEVIFCGWGTPLMG